LKRPHVVWAFLSYLALTIALTQPLLWNMTQAIASDAGDPVLTAWILWWNTAAVPLTDRWWNAGIFYPVKDAFTFSETMLGLVPLSAPMQWLTGNPALAFNFAFLLSFPLSAIAAYLLCFEISGRRDASWIAGIAYGFCPYRFDHLSHLHLLSAYWLPISLLALHRYLVDSRIRWLVLFGVTYILQGLVNAYFLLYVPVLVAIWTLWNVKPIRQWRTFAGIAAAGVVAVTLLLPVLLRYRDAHDRLGMVRSMDEVRFFSADASAILAPSQLLSIWGRYGQFRAPEAQLFPGLTIVLLVAAGYLRGGWPRALERPRWQRRLHQVARAITVGSIAALTARLIFGPYQLGILGLNILSVDRHDKTLSYVMIASLVWLLNSPVGVAARARRSPLPLYTLAAIVIFILTLGPSPQLLKAPILYNSPYNWLLRLPGFDGLRVPARFWMLAALCLAVAGGLAFRRLVAAESRARWAIAAAIGGAIFAESWIGRLPTADLPPRSALLERHAVHPVIELPFTSAAGDDNIGAMYRAIFHHQPIANGYSGYFAPHYGLLDYSLGLFEPEVLPQLAAFGVRDVLVWRRLDPDGRVAAFVAASPGAEKVAADDDATLYRLPAPASEDPPGGSLEAWFGPPLPIAALKANVNDRLTHFAVDGDRMTRWDTGLPQSRGNELVIDLGEPHRVGAVVLSLGVFSRDFPRFLTVEVSLDGEQWEETFRGPTLRQIFRASVRQPRDVPLDFALDGRTVRFIRLRQHQDDPAYLWSVAELQVLAPSR
jgi:hypothetical protein